MNPFKKDMVIKKARAAFEAFEVMGKTTDGAKAPAVRRAFNQAMIALGDALKVEPNNTPAPKTK